MGQYTPDVSPDDVERILRRDYPGADGPELRKLFEKVWERERPRTIVACMKMGGGNLEEFIRALNVAATDYRDVLSVAEYPHYSKKWFRIDKLAPQEVEELIEKDKRQYLEWFRR